MKRTLINVLSAVVIGCFVGVFSTKQLVSWLEEDNSKVQILDSDNYSQAHAGGSNYADIKFSGQSNEDSTLETTGKYNRIEEYNSFSYNRLDDQQKEVYENLIEGIENHSGRIEVPALDNSSISKCIEAVLADRPEFFWISGDSTIWSTGSVLTKEVELIQNIDTGEIPAIENKIEQIADDFIASLPGNATDYERVLAVYEYVILNTDYNLNSSQNQNIQSVFLNKESVCAGYAKATQYLLNRMGMKCAYISGTINRTDEYHAWNIVWVDGSCYYLDSTWGDPTYNSVDSRGNSSISYDYMCISSNELLRTHTPTTPDSLPECVSIDANYYVHEGFYMHGYDESLLVSMFEQSLYNYDDYTYVKFDNEEAFRIACERLFTDKVIDQVAQIKIKQDGLGKYDYSYFLNEDLFIIKMIW